ncbi:serine/arginine repetitive matrix protein 1-like isoform X2 [Hippopotamus amphibius kiboko]|uniref:serine/arginine repetitive matrix protein 1-like isoform X2 n=1 Tax=Hippopotamus amphibius kiboko TaxID=575201 RepID=UPI0025981FF9|nr:serine/arginine repetitive matrix protein 1-like isoform X2 [Hippopotamus amphibius kiboko]XP_057559546.1 serine/arginine repetitive matrix protein 1-like isoform X2 [Hippopotamus amphibius kiboko]
MPRGRRPSWSPRPRRPRPAEAARDARLQRPERRRRRRARPEGRRVGLSPALRRGSRQERGCSSGQPATCAARTPRKPRPPPPRQVSCSFQKFSLQHLCSSSCLLRSPLHGPSPPRAPPPGPSWCLRSPSVPSGEFLDQVVVPIGRRGEDFCPTLPKDLEKANLDSGYDTSSPNNCDLSDPPERGTNYQ